MKNRRWWPRLKKHTMIFILGGLLMESIVNLKSSHNSFKIKTKFNILGVVLHLFSKLTQIKFNCEFDKCNRIRKVLVMVVENKYYYLNDKTLQRLNGTTIFVPNSESSMWYGLEQNKDLDSKSHLLQHETFSSSKKVNRLS